MAVTEEAATDDGIAPPDEATLSPDDIPVVALGASPGALQALGDFLATVPGDAALAFVVVHHAAPDHESLMAELLSQRTALLVAAARDGVRVEPGLVYVIPPNRFLELDRGALKLRAADAPRGLRLPIDHFLHSLARERGRRAIAVILSGTGVDGAAGVACVAEEGGSVLVQDPDEAAYDGMPRAAMHAGMQRTVMQGVAIQASQERVRPALEPRCARGRRH